MSGLVSTTAIKGRRSGYTQGWTFRRFTDVTGSVTIAKPYGCTTLMIEVIGGGGGGAVGRSGDGSGGGGGGGALARYSFNAESLGETLTITVGAGGDGCDTGT